MIGRLSIPRASVSAKILAARTESVAELGFVVVGRIWIHFVHQGELNPEEKKDSCPEHQQRFELERA